MTLDFAGELEDDIGKALAGPAQIAELVDDRRLGNESAIGAYLTEAAQWKSCGSRVHPPYEPTPSIDEEASQAWKAFSF
jgi:hypothetical protein